ncbi:MAG: dipicolinate synthase subunit DpsA [Oscillospiraceae bacterium]|nr:dipicolinate synthase subunit DpsA [Oscillospiraceae bacterium]
MEKKFSFAIVGGDMRQINLAELLARDGHDVFLYAMEKSNAPDGVIQKNNISSLSNKRDCIILPLPATIDDKTLNAPFSMHKTSIDDLFSAFSTGQTVIAGKLKNSLFEKAGRSGIRLYDYLDREDFTVLNSIPTAEGAIECAMSETKTVLSGRNCLVIGFGHIGKLLCAKLRGLGANVYASARKSGDLAWISAYGYKPLHTAQIIDSIAEFDVIFNTVPAPLIRREELLFVKQNAFICDLASKPGGVDFDAARELEISAVHALSLPGKVAPLFAAESMRDTIYNILSEWGN